MEQIRLIECWHFVCESSGGPRGIVSDSDTPATPFDSLIGDAKKKSFQKLPTALATRHHSQP